MTPENGYIDGGGGECNFSLTIYKKMFVTSVTHKLLLDDMITKPIYIIPLNIQMLAMYLKFSTSSSFKIMQIVVIFPKNAHFLPPGVAHTTGLSHNPFTWRPL